MKYLRIDDVGASSKRYEIYGKNSIKINKRYYRFAPSFLTNFLFIKRLPFISGWGIYKEMNKTQWENTLNFLQKNKIVLNIAVTACWVEKDGSLTRFNNRFPEATEIINEGIKKTNYWMNN